MGNNSRKSQQSSQYSDSPSTGRSGDRIPMGERFSAPLQNGSEVHPASYTMRAESFSGGKVARGVVLNTRPI